MGTRAQSPYLILAINSNREFYFGEDHLYVFYLLDTSGGILEKHYNPTSSHVQNQLPPPKGIVSLEHILKNHTHTQAYILYS